MKVTVTNGETIKRGLLELPKKIQRKHLRTSLRVGAKIVQKQAKADAPERSGLLRRNIRIAGKTRRGRVTVLVMIGAKWFTGKAFYAAFVEFGHFVGKRAGALSKKFASRSDYNAASVKAGRTWVPGQHFMEKAFKSKVSAAVDASVAKMRELIDAERLD